MAKSRQVGSSTRLGVVIVSYNSAQELPACISALSKAVQAADIEVDTVVVDNNSKDDSVNAAKKSGTKVIANKKNLGFAAGVNQGIKKAFSMGAGYILILNPDVKLFPDSLKNMLKAMEPESSIGAVGPNLVNAAGQPASAGYYLKAPSWLSVLLFSTFLRPRALRSRFLTEHTYEETDLISDKEVEQIPGACLLTSKEVLDQVGLLDEDFAIWFEDVEWCYRARKRGYKMRFCAAAKVEHEGGASFEKWQSLDKAVTFYVSMKTFFDKHKPVSGFIVRLAMTLNSLALFVKNKDKSNLVFIKRFLTQRKGTLPS